MRVAQFVPAVIRRDRRWALLRRIYHEGWRLALRRHAIWSRILATRPFPAELFGSGSPVEIHLLCYEFDYLSAIWALKSFYHFARVKFPLAIHLQGYMPPRAVTRLRHHFPGARIIPQLEADRVVEEKLNYIGLRRLRGLRRRLPMMQKLTDFMLMSEAPRVLLLDSDVLFFAHPVHIVTAIDSGSLPALFMRDWQSAYTIAVERAREVVGFDLAPRVNAGLALVERRFIDLSRCDDYLRHEELMLVSGLTEQTLYALAASEVGSVNYLPDSYLMSPEPSIRFDGIVARHYAGPSRHLLLSEGMPRLIESGWLDEIRAN
jgi:hypothetical protein